MASKKPIKVAVVGLGRSGYNIHIKRMRDDKRFEVAAVTDWIGDRAKAVGEEFNCPWFDDHKKMLKEIDADQTAYSTSKKHHDRGGIGTPPGVQRFRDEIVQR